MRALVGELGAHLEALAEMLSVEAVHRGRELRLSGDPEAVDTAARVLRALYDAAEGGRSIGLRDIRDAVRILEIEPGAELGEYFDDVILDGVNRRRIAPRTVGQRLYLNAMRRHDVTFALGPAGTGKTYLAVAVAVAALRRGDVKRLVLTRPAVEAGEKLGFLPGDLVEKVDPYLRPLYDAMGEMIPRDKLSRLLERQIIEVAPLAFMRGRTLQDAYVLLDEAQNTTVEQMKMFLTRLGDRSRMVITGDITQIDLPPRATSGMVHAVHVLDGISGVAVVELSTEDVVRHPLVARIIEAYAADASLAHGHGSR